MKVAVSSAGETLESRVDTVFGRCAAFVCVDTETAQVTAWPNPAVAASGGAGIQAAQFVLDQKVDAVVSGNLGPNAMRVFAAAGVPVYAVQGGTVGEAVAAAQAGKLPAIQAPTVGSHHGSGGGR